MNLNLTISSFSCACTSLCSLWAWVCLHVHFCTCLCLWFVWWAEHKLCLYIHTYHYFEYELYFTQIKWRRIYKTYNQKYRATVMRHTSYSSIESASMCVSVSTIHVSPSLKAKCLFQHVAFTAPGTHTYAQPLFRGTPMANKQNNTKYTGGPPPPPHPGS